jgi:hypothetical protein
MNIALVSVLSGVLGVVVGVVMPISREWLARSRDARYLAIRIVCILDRYVEDCASTAIDSGQENEKGESVAQVSAPPPPPARPAPPTA